jgi:stage II sporulation protein D
VVFGGWNLFDSNPALWFYHCFTDFFMKNVPVFVIYILLPLFVCLLSADAAFAVEPPLQSKMIRVAIVKVADTVNIDGVGLLVTDDTGNNVSLEFPALFRIDRGRVLVSGNSARLIRIAAAGLVKVNGKSYRGLVELSPQNGKLLVVNELGLEQYLVGVINSEISSTWPMESIKTQAVIARTFAVAKKRERSKAFYHLESTVMDQAYDGSDLEDSRAARGVHETEGEVLTYNGSVIQAFYHANSGGRTEASQNVWGLSLPYLQGVECQYGLTSTTSNWEQSLSLNRIETALKISRITDILAGQKNNRGRLKSVLLVTERGNLTIPATKFRMAIGSTVIKSTNFTVRVDGGTALFRGSGYGHGVGLCQYGAKQRALDGFSYVEILSYYYPGTRLGTLSDK